MHTNRLVPLVVVGFIVVLSGRAHGNADAPVRRMVSFAGTDRAYYVRLPRDYAPESIHWMLVSVHGGGGNGQSHFLAADLRDAADAQGLDAIVVSPSFSNTDPQASRFPALGEGAFLMAVLDDVRREYVVHPRILLTGYSRGGQFSHRFALAHPELVEAAAPFAAGTWTTPDGVLLIEGIGAVRDAKAFLSDPANASRAPERLQGLFTTRVAKVAGAPTSDLARRVPFLVMCGSQDTRFEIAQAFADSLSASGFKVITHWPRTPHGSRDSPAYRAEFKKYGQEAVRFFLRVTREE